MKKIFTLLLTLATSIQLFANAEIEIYSSETGLSVTSSSPQEVSTKAFKNIIEAGDKIIVTVSDYVVGSGGYWQIDYSKNWSSSPSLGNGDLEIVLTSDDVTNVKGASNDRINFSANSDCSYKIKKVIIQKNDSYSDVVDITVESIESSDSWNKAEIASTACTNISDGDLIIVKTSTAAGTGWTMQQKGGSNFTTTPTGEFTGRDFAYIVASGIGSEMRTSGIKIGGNPNEMRVSNVYLAKKIYSLDESSTPDFSSIVQNSPINVKLTRTFKYGWNTICLPFATNASDIATGAEVYNYTSANASYINFTKVDDGAMAAGTPYMVKLTSAISDPITFTNVTVSTTTAGSASEINGLTFKGNFTTSFDMINKYGLHNYGGGTSKIEKGSSGATLKAFSAYFDGSVSGSRGFEIGEGDGTTGIDAFENVEVEETGPVYNLMGQQITTPRKGLYIKNGKKYLAK